MKQVFLANSVSIEGEAPDLVAFGDLTASGDVAHSLMIGASESGQDLYCEFNDQSNTCDENAITRAELSDESFRVLFGPGKGLRGGTTEDPGGKALEELEIRFSVSDDELQKLNAALSTMLQMVAYRYVGHRLKMA